MYHAYNIVSNKSLPIPRSYTYSPMFPCRCFIILGFTFRSVIYFVSIVVHDEKYEINFTFLYGYAIVETFVEKAVTFQ